MSMALIQKLHEDSLAAQKQARDISDLVAAENRDFTAEEEGAWQKANKDYDEISGRVKELLDHEARSADIAKRLGELGDQKDADNKPGPVSDEARLRAILTERRGTAEFGPESRTLSKLTAGAGGNVVPTGFYDALFEAIVEASSVMAANATVLNTASGENIQLPLTSTFPAAAQVAEAATIGASDPSFGQTTIGAYKFAFLTQGSTELLDDNAVNLVEFLGRRGGEAIGNGIGAAFITGSGSGTPTGIVGAAGFATVASAAGSVAAGFTYNDILTLQHSITRPYRNGASFICNDSVTLQLRKLRDGSGGAGTGQYLWQPAVTLGAPETLAGNPIYTDPAMPTATTNGTKGLAFGNWSRGFVVRIAGGVRVELSTEFAFSSDLTTWRFITRADSRIVDTNAARVLTYTT